MTSVDGLQTDAVTSSSRRMTLLSVSAALGYFVVLQMAAYLTAGGHFEYPLDDPYIHMAMAEQIVAGNYGINNGETVAAASSPVFPLLLLPLAGSPLQLYLPLLWNVVGLFVCAVLWARILWKAGYQGPTGLFLAAVGPFFLNMGGVAFSGMEHSLHVAASLSIVLGLLIFADDRRIGFALILGVLLAPAFRVEGLALALLASGAVAISGRWRAGIGLGLLAVLPVAVFAMFLMSLGLDPMPNSIRVKLSAVGPEESGIVAYLANKAQQTWDKETGRALILFVAVGLALLAVPDIRKSRRVIVLLTVTGAGMAHLLFGRFGWFDRYENYIMATMAAGLLAVSARPGVDKRNLMPVFAFLPAVISGTYYLQHAVIYYPSAPRDIRVQQGEVARLAKELLDEPVAVNDVGHVAWQNSNYVLDLAGLGNDEAAAYMFEKNQPDGWMDALTAKHGTVLAMVYDSWYEPEAMGEDWRQIGVLITEGPAYFLGDNGVAFYLTEGDADPAPYLDAIREWKKDIPEGAYFRFEKEFAE
ncbi:hypothetical protein [Pseudoruegeria sp. HB172150]|uniref:hypothetical protein n=1 Tax=Pseudoruegeria sp. HB172150 TaxID=2721164 RepID=UPI00155233A0|nr:hypothetical protein [Pseudoruegeria sp. HB172150]